MNTTIAAKILASKAMYPNRVPATQRSLFR